MTRRRLGAAVALMLGWMLLWPATAQAHAHLLRANPADGAVLTESPREVYLWFDEPVAATFSAAHLLDAQGQPVGEVSLRADPADPDLLIATLPPTTPGIYSLAWKTVSTIDNHTTQGTLVFGVNRTVSGERASATESPAALTEAVLRALLYSALSVLIGGVVSAGFVLRDSRLASLRNRAVTIAWRGAVATLIIGLVSFARQGSLLERGTWLELLQSRYGLLWMVQQELLVVALLTLTALRRRLIWGGPGVGIALAGIALAHSLNSHAAGIPGDNIWPVLSQAVHLIAAGAWVGSVAVLVIVLWAVMKSDNRELALTIWRRFSLVALVCVGALAVTGLFNTAQQVATVDAWLTTLYGQVLSAKTAMVLVVGLVGLINSTLLHPRVSCLVAAVLGRLPGWGALAQKHLPQTVKVEMIGGVIVLIWTGWLTATAPARGPEFLVHPATEPTPALLTQTAADLTINLQIRPNQPGPNIITVGVFNTRRPAPAAIARVFVRLTPRSGALDTQTLIAEGEANDRYHIQSNGLSLAGSWTAQVVIRRNGMEDAIANFDWQVAPLAASAPPRPVIYSNQPIASLLYGLALTLLALIVVAGVGATGRRIFDNLPQSEAT